jgi:GNAT superfamily N-acetyltransferase
LSFKLIVGFATLNILSMTNHSLTEQTCNILLVKTPEDIKRCFTTFQELRPKLVNPDHFIEQVLRQMQEGYILCCIEDQGHVLACMGYRVFETLAWNRILYIDDLITQTCARKQGLGRKLLNYAIEQARQNRCAEIHLDSGHQRHDAHRLYLNTGFTLHCHHFSLPI